MSLVDNFNTELKDYYRDSDFRRLELELELEKDLLALEEAQAKAIEKLEHDYTLRGECLDARDRELGTCIEECREAREEAEAYQLKYERAQAELDTVHVALKQANKVIDKVKKAVK